MQENKNSPDHHNEQKSQMKKQMTKMVAQTDPTEKLKEVFDNKVEYMCYGDLIMLTYSKKIFKQDIDEHKHEED